VANLFVIPLSLINISTISDLYAYFKLFVLLLIFVWIITIIIFIIFYQTLIISVSSKNEIVHIKYIKFIFVKSIDLWAEDLKAEMYKVNGSYVLKLFNDHFCIRQRQSFEWKRGKFKDFYYKMKSEGFFIKTTLFK
jgi:hypothetical protein